MVSKKKIGVTAQNLAPEAATTALPALPVLTALAAPARHAGASTAAPQPPARVCQCPGKGPPPKKDSRACRLRTLLVTACSEMWVTTQNCRVALARAGRAAWTSQLVRIRPAMATEATSSVSHQHVCFRAQVVSGCVHL